MADQRTEQRKAFDAAASAAVVEAATTREELGRASAATFQTDPDNFDPNDLLKLGDAGLHAFSAALEIEHSAPTASTAQARFETQKHVDWSSRQREGIPFERAGLIAGIVAGVVAIGAVSLRAWLNG